MKCKTHPDAPHGFDRNGSHSADRYVCMCEHWNPPCDMGEMCLDCQPRGPNGECPDAHYAPTANEGSEP
jgi:hypothetical protein